MMEAFQVFATLNLVDLMSGPLGRVQAAMAATKGHAAGLGDSMGRLAVSMAPVAAAAGALLGAFGACTRSAMDFEESMAEVRKVVDFDSAAEFDAMGKSIQDMSARIPMAASGIADIIAAAGQSGIAKNDLQEFAEQAAKMGVAFDLTGAQAGKMMADWRAGMNLTLPQVYSLGDAVNYLSNHMNATAPALGEVIQRMGATAMACGLTETQVAALGAAFLSAGAAPEVASTALKNFVTTLTQGSAMTKTQITTLKKLGFSAGDLAKGMQKDAEGTMKAVLGAIAALPRENQMSVLTQLFGEESIGAIAPLLQNVDNLNQAFDLVRDKARYAGSMQSEFDQRARTTKNALQLLGNRVRNLAIAIGKAFLPAITAGANALGVIAEALRAVAESAIGQWLISLAGALSTAVIAVTAFSAASWGLSRVMPLITGTLAPLRAALVGLGVPFWALIAVIGTLYAVYKSNFAGIGDTIDRWAKNVSLVIRGVIAAFQSLTGSTVTIKGELAKQLDASGLTPLVINISKAIYRVKSLFTGFWEGLDFSKFTELITPAMLRLMDAITSLGSAIGKLFGVDVSSEAASWENFGEILGSIVSVGFGLLGAAINAVVQGLSILKNLFDWVIAIINGDWTGALNAARGACDSLVSAVMGIADSLGIGDAIRAAFDDVVNFLNSIDLSECGRKILETLKTGILSAAGSIKDAVSGVFDKIGSLLPHSDAKEGPLSTLTLSGQKMMTTLAGGVALGAGTLQGTVSRSLEPIGQNIRTALTDAGGAALPALDTSNITASLTAIQGMTSRTLSIQTPEVPMPDGTTGTEGQQERARQAGDTAAQPRYWTLHIANITLPNVKDANSFYDELRQAATEYGEGLA